MRWMGSSVQFLKLCSTICTSRARALWLFWLFNIPASIVSPEAFDSEGETCHLNSPCFVIVRDKIWWIFLQRQTGVMVKAQATSIIGICRSIPCFSTMSGSARRQRWNLRLSMYMRPHVWRCSKLSHHKSKIFKRSRIICQYLDGQIPDSWSWQQWFEKMWLSVGHIQPKTASCQNSCNLERTRLARRDGFIYIHTSSTYAPTFCFTSSSGSHNEPCSIASKVPCLVRWGIRRCQGAHLVNGHIYWIWCQGHFSNILWVSVCCIWTIDRAQTMTCHSRLRWAYFCCICSIATFEKSTLSWFVKPKVKRSALRLYTGQTTRGLLIEPTLFPQPRWSILASYDRPVRCLVRNGLSFSNVLNHSYSSELPCSIASALYLWSQNLLKESSFCEASFMMLELYVSVSRRFQSL